MSVRSITTFISYIAFKVLDPLSVCQVVAVQCNQGKQCSRGSWAGGEREGYDVAESKVRVPLASPLSAARQV